MKSRFALAILATILVPQMSVAQPYPTILPVALEPVSYAAPVSDAQVQQTISIIKSLYDPVAARLNRRYNITYRQSAPGASAGTFWDPRTKIAEISISGALARLLTQDQVGLVLCHELGHVYGGQPYRLRYDKEPENTSTEGQADYHAMRSCMRRYLALAPATEAPQTTPFMQQKCAAGFGPSGTEYDFCLRALAAGMFLPIIAKANGDNIQVSYETPDARVVDKTIVGRWGTQTIGGMEATAVLDTYPSNQCRTDTFLTAYFQQPRLPCWYNPADGTPYEEVFSGPVPQPSQPSGPTPPPVTPPPATPPSANDLAGHPLEGEVRTAIGLGLIRTYRDGTFRPGADITRLETALLVNRLVSLSAPHLIEPSAAMPYPDVTADNPFIQQLAFVKTHGLITPFADGTFRPNKEINRGYFSASLYKTVKIVLTALQRPPLGGQGGQDFSNTEGHWSKAYAKLLSGFCNAAFSENGGGFEPEKNTTRAYATASALRALQCIKKQ